MRLEKEFVVARPRSELVEQLGTDETIRALFPDTEIEHKPDGSLETRTRYDGLGISREIRFIFTTPQDIHFSKICDGNVWRELKGSLRFRERGGRTRVRIAMDGRTKNFVPEFTIKGAMRDQIEQMAQALRDRLEDDDAE